MQHAACTSSGSSLTAMQRVAALPLAEDQSWLHVPALPRIMQILLHSSKQKCLPAFTKHKHQPWIASCCRSLAVLMLSHRDPQKILECTTGRFSAMLSASHVHLCLQQLAGGILAMYTLLCKKLEIGQFSSPSNNNSSKEAEHTQSTQHM